MTYKAYPSFLVLELYKQILGKLPNKTSTFYKNCRFHSAIKSGHIYNNFYIKKRISFFHNKPNYNI